ncbi:serine/arginine-rich splicing factor 7-like [Octopus vulgaris]|uniref:Serine/arginine-rich splicing factor 7-like n=1 Tax=Octopus vulgaris TaxID=6645 RepID=A0AA36C0J2_OCTVU|nr:serine/arginine-rich splicing factor 7-like [Octopus vulgaris]
MLGNLFLFSEQRVVHLSVVLDPNLRLDNGLDAEDAVRALDGTNVCGARVRVEHSTGKVRPKPWMRGGTTPTTALGTSVPDDLGTRSGTPNPALVRGPEGVTPAAGVAVGVIAAPPGGPAEATAGIKTLLEVSLKSFPHRCWYIYNIIHYINVCVCVCVQHYIYIYIYIMSIYPRIYTEKKEGELAACLYLY